jgi:RimJ/RimL family protein N-acetyltransferase
LDLDGSQVGKSYLMPHLTYLMILLLGLSWERAVSSEEQQTQKSQRPVAIQVVKTGRGWCSTVDSNNLVMISTCCLGENAPIFEKIKDLINDRKNLFLEGEIDDSYVKNESKELPKEVQENNEWFFSYIQKQCQKTPLGFFAVYNKQGISLKKNKKLEEMEFIGVVGLQDQDTLYTGLISSLHGFGLGTEMKSNVIHYFFSPELEEQYKKNENLKRPMEIFSKILVTNVGSQLASIKSGMKIRKYTLEESKYRYVFSLKEKEYKKLWPN